MRELTADHVRQARDDALHSLRSQLQGRQCRNLGGRIPLTIVKKEDHAVPFTVRAIHHTGKHVIDLLQSNLALDRVRTARARCGCSRVGLSPVGEGFGPPPGTALSGMLRLEMIVDNVGGHHLQESENGSGMLGLEGAQQATVVVAQFEIGILD